jgi:hypothetical protein
MLWRLNYSREANNYILDSYPYNEAVVMAIQTLALMPSPYPPGVTQAKIPGIMVWRVADHDVYYRVDEDVLTLIIMAIHPL